MSEEIEYHAQDGQCIENVQYIPCNYNDALASQNCTSTHDDQDYDSPSENGHFWRVNSVLTSNRFSRNDDEKWEV